MMKWFVQFEVNLFSSILNMAWKKADCFVVAQLEE